MFISCTPKVSRGCITDFTVNDNFQRGISPHGFLVEGALATIAWTFVMPYEALAETCESDSGSLPNMPLLFTIALIGATVGGNNIDNIEPFLQICFVRV